jgi:hypothetical protein
VASVSAPEGFLVSKPGVYKTGVRPQELKSFYSLQKHRFPHLYDVSIKILLVSLVSSLSKFGG